MKSYIFRGQRIFATPLSAGGPYGTVYETPNGGTHRLRFRDLPVRDTLAEATRDLKSFARVRGLKEAEE